MAKVLCLHLHCIILKLDSVSLLPFTHAVSDHLRHLTPLRSLPLSHAGLPRWQQITLYQLHSSNWHHITIIKCHGVLPSLLPTDNLTWIERLVSPLGKYWSAWKGPKSQSIAMLMSTPLGGVAFPLWRSFVVLCMTHLFEAFLVDQSAWVPMGFHCEQQAQVAPAPRGKSDHALTGQGFCSTENRPSTTNITSVQ